MSDRRSLAPSAADTLHLRKFVAPEFIFGKGARFLAGRYAANSGGNTILLVTDEGVLRAGWGRDVARSLEDSGLKVVVFSEVHPNPRSADVMHGAEVYRRHACDVIAVVGGGSPMDCAKGIGIVIANGGHILDYEGVDNVSLPIPPLVCVPTTGGSSADVSQFAIITDEKARRKIAIITKAIVPDVSLIDPETLATMDQSLRACSGMDALTHGIEAYVSNAHAAMTDLCALSSVRLVYRNLPLSVERPQEPELRDKVMLGSMQAGLAFSNASLGAVHAMAHAAGGLLDMPHGLCNAILLGPVIEYNFRSAPERYRQIAEAMNLALGPTSAEGEVLEALLDAIGGLKHRLHIPRGFQECRMQASDIARLAENALRDACMATNPRLPRSAEIESIYEKAL